MNNGNTQLSRMVTDPRYLTSTQNTISQGYLFQADWDVTPKLILTYKFEEMLLDRKFHSDFYRRHGLGPKFYFGPNLALVLRMEMAKATHPTEQNNPKLGAQNAYWATVNVSF